MRSSARILAVTSGKGGVGKSNVVANLALALGRLGKSVIVFDADLGMANLDVLFGVRPTHTLYHVVKGKRDLTEILVPCGVGVKFIAGGSGMRELADLDAEGKERLLSALRRLERFADILLIDTGAGISSNVMRFVSAAREVLLVTTPEPTAMADAYGVIKAVCAAVEAPPSVDVVVNRVKSPDEAAFVARRLAKVAARFLEFKSGYAGYVLEDPVVPRAVKLQKPFVEAYPNSPASVCIANIAANLIGVEPRRKAAANGGLGVSLFEGLMAMLRGREKEL